MVLDFYRAGGNCPSAAATSCRLATGRGSRLRCHPWHLIPLEAALRIAFARRSNPFNSPLPGLKYNSLPYGRLSVFYRAGGN